MGEDKNKGVIIEEDSGSPRQNRGISRMRGIARNAVLGGIGLAATATGIGLSLDAQQNSHRIDAPSPKPIPSLVEALPMPTATPISPDILKIPERMDLSDLWAMAPEDRNKKIWSLEQRKLDLKITGNNSVLAGFTEPKKFTSPQSDSYAYMHLTTNSHSENTKIITIILNEEQYKEFQEDLFGLGKKHEAGDDDAIAYLPMGATLHLSGYRDNGGGISTWIPFHGFYLDNVSLPPKK